MRLNDLQVKNLPVPDRGQKTYWDQGFGVRVSQGGSRTFVAKISGRQHTLGRYPAISLKDARREAMRLKVQETPQKRLERLSEATEAYLKHCDSALRPSTAYTYRLYLGEVTKTYLSDVKRSDVQGPHRVAAWRAFFNWCIREEITDRNPFLLSKTEYNERDRVLNPDEIRQVWAYTFPPYSDYLKLQLLTGQRIGQWQTYSCSDDVITFPAEVMKSKRKHFLPLTEMVKQLLPLPSYAGWSKAKSRIDRHVKLDPWTVHDLRRTFSTICAELGVPQHITEEILAHRSQAKKGVAGIYNRYNYIPEMRDALTRYEEHLQSIVT